MVSPWVLVWGFWPALAAVCEKTRHWWWWLGGAQHSNGVGSTFSALVSTYKAIARTCVDPGRTLEGELEELDVRLSLSLSVCVCGCTRAKLWQKHQPCSQNIDQARSKEKESQEKQCPNPPSSKTPPNPRWFHGETIHSTSNKKNENWRTPNKLLNLDDSDLTAH